MPLFARRIRQAFCRVTRTASSSSTICTFGVASCPHLGQQLIAFLLAPQGLFHLLPQHLGPLLKAANDLLFCGSRVFLSCWS
jgi:hypothetical protein